MEEAPSLTEIARLLAQLAQIAAGHADVARAASGLLDQPGARDQLRQSFALLTSGQDELAKALQQIAQIFQTMGADADQPEN